VVLIEVANNFFENVGKFKYLGAIATNQNCIREEKTKSGECTLPCSSESLVFPCAFQKLRLKLQNCNVNMLFYMGAKQGLSLEEKNTD
jgi:hypothetical protein